MRHTHYCATGLLLLLVCSPVAAESQRMVDGKKAYMSHCARCHDQGMEGAPTIEDTQQWATRSDLWEAVLFEHAAQGYISMPPKGGAEDASDYEVKAAAEYMLSTAHPEQPSD